MQLKDAIKERQNTERFSHKKPNWRKIIQAIDAARYAPNAGDQFVMKFILVSDKNKIKRISDATQQPFVRTARYVVVAVSDDSVLVRSYDKRGTRYAALQSGAAIENFLLELTELGLVTYWVKHFFEEKIRDTLDIPKEMVIEGIFPIGKKTKIKTKKEYRVDLDNCIFFDKWDNKKMSKEVKVTTERS